MFTALRLTTVSLSRRCVALPPSFVTSPMTRTEIVPPTRFLVVFAYARVYGRRSAVFGRSVSINDRYEEGNRRLFFRFISDSLRVAHAIWEKDVLQKRESYRLRFSESEIIIFRAGRVWGGLLVVGNAVKKVGNGNINNNYVYADW